MEDLQLGISKKQMEFQEIFNKILRFMEKITFNALGAIVMDIFKRFQYPADQPFTVQNVRSNDNKYLLTKTHVRVI